jgi:hypothetical protein
MPQLQKAIPLAAAPLRKFLRVVMFLSLESRVFPFGRSIAGLFLIVYPGTLPIHKQKSNHSHANQRS